MATNLNHTPKFEWCMFRSKNGHQKHLYLKEIELNAQNMLAILGSIYKRERERDVSWLQYLTLKNHSTKGSSKISTYCCLNFMSQS